MSVNYLCGGFKVHVQSHHVRQYDTATHAKSNSTIEYKSLAAYIQPDKMHMGLGSTLVKDQGGHCSCSDTSGAAVR